MIRSENIASNDVVADVVINGTTRYKEVIQTPANIFRPGIHHVGPEGVGLFLVRIEVTECIDKTGLQ